VKKKKMVNTALLPSQLTVTQRTASSYSDHACTKRHWQ